MTTATRPRAPTRPTVLGQLLVERGVLPEDALRRALERQAGCGRRLGEILREEAELDPSDLAEALAHQLGLEYAAAPLEPDPAAARLLTEEVARDRGVIPLSAGPRLLRLAMEDPLDLTALDEVAFRTGRRVEPVVATGAAIRRALAGVHGGELERLVAALPGGDAGDGEDPEILERSARAAPVVRLVDHLLEDAARQGASDVHVEGADAGDPGGDGAPVRVRYRVDGVLREAASLPGRARSPVLSRLKIMAGMDIAVKRRPQDGGLALARDGRTLTLRVSTLPLEGGEKAVIRLLDPEAAPRDLEALGPGADDLERLRALLRAGQGVLLAAGPTGSGKSSTLHAALKEVDRARLNVVTLEDPVEYRLPGVTHVQVAPRAGLTFPAALRSVLRQDPDVIMVGEIRDLETAEIAMAAAVTGHLVLSTIHTTDAPGAVTRLLHMGVPPYLVAGGLAGVVAQRLVRTVCRECGGRAERGCGACRDGYRGRTGVFQVLTMTDRLRDEVVRNGGSGGSATLRRLAREGGMGTMAEDARRKVAEGTTTPHEVGRVLRGDPGAGLPCSGCGGPVPAEAEGCPTCGLRRVRRCRCGRIVRRGWRFCAWCLAPARG